MREIIKLVGKHNDLELGYIEHNTYYETGLLADVDHSWKILSWIDQNIQDGFPIVIVKRREDMMEESKRKNRAVLEKIVEGAFRNSTEMDKR